MRLKTFRLFENEMPEDMVRMQDGGMYDKKTVYPELGPDTYYPDDFLAFVGAVHHATHQAPPSLPPLRRYCRQMWRNTPCRC